MKYALILFTFGFIGCLNYDTSFVISSNLKEKWIEIET